MDPQMGPKMASKTLKNRPRLRGASGEPFWSHFGLILDPPEGDFRASGGSFESVRGAFLESRVELWADTFASDPGGSSREQLQKLRDAPHSNRPSARAQRACESPAAIVQSRRLRLTMLFLLLPCCSSRCSCSGLSSFPMLFRLFFGLQCSTLPCLSRFPFHDSQVSVFSEKWSQN